MRANIRTQAKTWLRIEMSARVIPVAICLTSSFSGHHRVRLRCTGDGAGAGLQGGHGLDLDTVGEAVGALDHHRLLRLDPGEDLDGPVPGAQADLDRTQVRLALVHHVGHEALLAGLDRALGHDQRVLAGFAGEGHLGEEARLQRPRVLDPGQDLDLAGRGVGHLAHVVDPGREVLGTEGGHAELHVPVLARPQRLAVRDLEPQAQSARVHEGGEHVPELHVLAGLHGARVDHAGRGAPASPPCGSSAARSRGRRGVTSTAAASRAFSPRERVISSAATSCASESSSRRFRSAWARPSSAWDCSRAALARSSSSR